MGLLLSGAATSLHYLPQQPLPYSDNIPVLPTSYQDQDATRRVPIHSFCPPMPRKT